MVRTFLKWIALLFLIVESLGLVASLLKLVLNLTASEGVIHESLGEAALDVTLHVAIVALILSAYLSLRAASRLPPILTRQSALLTASAAQSAFYASIALYALADLMMPVHVEPTLIPLAWVLCASTLGTIYMSLLLRRRFLSEAEKELSRDPENVRALRQWRKFTILSMVLAMAVGLYGFVLRAQGYSRVVEWSFFVFAAVLLFLWRPRLNSNARGSTASTAPSITGQERGNAGN